MFEWPNDFAEQFWKLYPRKVDKKKAIQSLDKIKKYGKIDFDLILAGVKTYCISVSGKDVEFIKHPTTWLNGECWKNEIQTGLLPNMPLRTQIDIEDAIRMFARFGYWSRYAGPAPGLQHSLATPELMAKHGMLEDGRKIRKIAYAPRIQQADQAAGIRESERLL